MKSFRKETLEQFSKAMQQASFPFGACGMIDDDGKIREFTEEEKEQLGISAFPMPASTGKVVRKKPYCRPGSKLTVSYGEE